MTSLESLYRNLDNKATTELKGKKPLYICDRLEKIYNLGIENKEKKVYHSAYVYFKRWIYCVEWLKTQRLDDGTKNKYFPKNEIKNVNNLLQEVSNIITKEFERNKKLKEDIKSANLKVIEPEKPRELDLELQLPEIPKDEPQPRSEDEITCRELYTLLTNFYKASRVLVIDLREEEDFLRSRISSQYDQINIPAEKVHPKRSPFYYYSILMDKEAKKKFKERSAEFKDVIVLLDYSSSLNTMKKDSALAIFKDSLENMDPHTTYKRIAVLKGGFDEWMTLYPGSVISVPIKQIRQESPSNSVNDSERSMQNSVASMPLKVSSASPILSSRPAGVPAKPYPSPSSQIMNDYDLFNNLNIDVSRLQLGQPIPSTMMNGSFNDQQILKTKNIRDSKVLVKKLPTEKPTIDRTKKPVPGRKLSSDDEIIRIEKELKEAMKIVAMYTEMSNKGVLDEWSNEQLAIYLKKEQSLTSELRQLKNTGNQQTLDTRSKTLYPDLTETIASVKSKPKIRSSAPPIRHPEDLSENKENIQKPKETTVTLERKKVIQPPPEDMDQDEDMQIYTKPIKNENQFLNTGLKRSHSSPDLKKIIQKEESEKPQINRSLKPQVKDRNQIQNKEDRMDPVFSPSGYLHPGITGLKNLGNSCYMNSIIQCLSNTVCLAKYFNNNMYTNDLNKKNDRGITGYVAEEVAQVIKALWRGQYKSISPRDLKVVVGQYKLQFENYEQQDSHEFLTFLLDWMHNDLKQKSKIINERDLTTAETEWYKSMDGQCSIISQLFSGQLRSTIQCSICYKNSTTYETFNSLTMSLPNSNKCTLDDCVKKFVSGQSVSEWKCPHCKVPRNGVKKFDLAKLPHVLVIHLNRFGETGGWLEKRNTAVEFPLQNFNLRPYLCQDADNINNSQSCHYNLYAISNHYGTMDGGHYTAYCKIAEQQKWYKYDDHTVTEVPQSQVKNQSNSAYLLFYARASTDNYPNS